MKTTWCAAFLLASIAAVGCQAYADAANGVLNSGLVKLTDGSVKVRNALSVPICKITVFDDKEPNRSDNDLAIGGTQGLGPGGEASASIPHVGKAGDPTPPDTTYG